MKLKGLFWILTGLLLTILSVLSYFVFTRFSSLWFFVVEGLVGITVI